MFRLRSGVVLTVTVAFAAFLTSGAVPSVAQTTPSAIKRVVMIGPNSTRSLPVRGTVILRPAVPDTAGVKSVIFYLDGNGLGTVNTMPFRLEWDSTTKDDGEYVLKAIGSTDTGEELWSGEGKITVANKTPAPVATPPTMTPSVPPPAPGMKPSVPPPASVSASAKPTTTPNRAVPLNPWAATVKPIAPGSTPAPPKPAVVAQIPPKPTVSPRPVVAPTVAAPAARPPIPAAPKPPAAAPNTTPIIKPVPKPVVPPMTVAKPKPVIPPTTVTKPKTLTPPTVAKPKPETPPTTVAKPKPVMPPKVVTKPKPPASVAANPASVTWKTYTDSKYGFVGDYPGTARVLNESAHMKPKGPGSFWIAFKQTSSGKPWYAINVRHMKTHEPGSPDKFAKYNPYLLNWDRTNVAGVDGFKTVSGRASSKMVIHRTLLVANRDVWMLNLTDVSGNDANITGEIFKRFIDSFRPEGSGGEGHAVPVTPMRRTGHPTPPPTAVEPEPVPPPAPAPEAPPPPSPDDSGY